MMGWSSFMNRGGVVTVGLVMSSIAQGCPLSGVLFVCAADLIGRRTHATLARSKSGILRQCADDTAVLLRSARLLASLPPAFVAAGRFAGVRRKPKKCEVVLIGGWRDAAAQGEGCRVAIVPEARSYGPRVCRLVG